MFKSNLEISSTYDLCETPPWPVELCQPLFPCDFKVVVDTLSLRMSSWYLIDLIVSNVSSGHWKYQSWTPACLVSLISLSNLTTTILKDLLHLSSIFFFLHVMWCVSEVCIFQ